MKETPWKCWLQNLKHRACDHEENTPHVGTCGGRIRERAAPAGNRGHNMRKPAAPHAADALPFRWHQHWCPASLTSLSKPQPQVLSGRCFIP